MIELRAVNDAYQMVHFNKSNKQILILTIIGFSQAFYRPTNLNSARHFLFNWFLQIFRHSNV